jgi:hypothetical protein
MQDWTRLRIVSVMEDPLQPNHGHIIQALRMATECVEQELAGSSGLEVGQVAILMHLSLHQPATIPDVAAGVGHGYRWAQGHLKALRRRGEVVRWPSNPARFALSDAGTILAEQMDGAVWNSIASGLVWPAAVIASRVLDLLTGPIQVPSVHMSAAPTRLSNAVLAAQFVRVEPSIIDVWGPKHPAQTGPKG